MFILGGSQTATIVASGHNMLPIARELRRCLSVALGKRFDITTGDDNGDHAPCVSLSIQPELADRSRGDDKEVIAWHCDGKARLEISGSTRHALWLAVYAFLKEHVGCRWFFPGKLGEDIPSLKQVRLGKLDTVHRPSFITRDWRNWPEAFRRQMFASEHDLGIAHAYYTIVPAEVAREHPEYTSMLNGERRGVPPYQLCVSQQGVEDRAVAYCLDWFKQRPDAPNVSICPNDTDMFCDCPQCVTANLNGQAGKTRHPTPAHWVSRSICDFSNRVAKRVSEVYPDKQLVVNSYGRSERPPTHLKVHDNVVVWYATWAIQSGAPRYAAKMDEEVGGWCKVAKNVAIYEYLVNQSWPGLPRPIPAQVARCIKKWHRQGVRHYYSQHTLDFGMNLPNYHVAAALCWNVKASPKAILDDLYARCFRKAGPAIRAYYEILEKAVMIHVKRDLGPGALGVFGHSRIHEQLQVIYTPKVLAEAEAAIGAARKAAAGDDVAVRRVRIVANGLTLLKAAIAVSRQTYAFENRFFVPVLSIRPWHIGNYDYDSAVEKLHLYGERCVSDLRALTEAWRDYDKLRRRLSRTPTVAEFWSRGASFNPLPRLENIDKLYRGEIDRATLRAGRRAETRVV